MKAPGIEREAMAIGQKAAAGALADCGAAQSEPEDVGGWLNSLSPKAFKGKGCCCNRCRPRDGIRKKSPPCMDKPHQLFAQIEQIAGIGLLLRQHIVKARPQYFVGRLRVFQQ